MSGPQPLSKAEWWRRAQQRFWSKVDICGPDECWLWTAHVNQYGYGKFNWRSGKIIGAHRAAFILTHEQSVEAKMDICHTCDDKLCCNPKHLYEGTRSENMLDAVERGYILVGSQRPDAKLNENAVKRIRILHARGWSYYQLTALFGVCPNTIMQADTYKTWRHVE